MNWAAGLLGKPIHPSSAIVPTPHLGVGKGNRPALTYVSGCATLLAFASTGRALGETEGSMDSL